MDLAALKSEVQSNIADTSTATSSRITNWLNWAVHRMARRYDWNDLISLDTTSYNTVASTETVALATTVKKIYNIRYIDTTDDGKCKTLTYRPAYFQNNIRPYPAGDAENTPVYYWTVGRTIYLNPIPDSAKDLYIISHAWPTAMSATTDEPSITNVDDAIVAGATYRAYKSMPQLDGAEFANDWDREFWTLTREANIADERLGGWRAILRRHNAVGLSLYNSVSPTSDPFVQNHN